jgi:hypothetical protein
MLTKYKLTGFNNFEILIICSEFEKLFVFKLFERIPTAIEFLYYNFYK